MKNNYLATDPQAVNDLLGKMPELKIRGLNVLEPAAGNGVLADRYKLLTHNEVDMFDIEPRRDDIEQQDYMKLDCKGKYDLILTSFPSEMADKNNPIGYSQLLRKALIDVKYGGYVANFQKLAQLESKQRYQDIYGKYKPYKILIYSRRISCYKNGDLSQKVQGAVAYSWAIWRKDEDGFFSKETKLDWIY